MKLPRRQFLHLAAGAGAPIGGLAFPGSRAWPQGARTIKLVVPFPPGGGIDALARVMAEEVGRTHGVVVVVENRPGAGTVIATEAVLRAKPDGNTLLFTLNSFLVAAHTRKLSYDPLTSFEPICTTGSTPPVIVVDARSPYRSLDDLIRAARAKPGELTYALVTGTSLMVGFEMLNRDAGMKMSFVPFAGTAPSVTAVFGGHVTATMVDYPAAAGQLQAGNLRALATESGTRMEWLPQVPTVAELGYKNIDLDLWYGLFVPKADLFSGQVQVMFDTLPAVIAHVRSGKLRALAVGTPTRSEAVPDLPPLAESLPGYAAGGLGGMGAPKDTPASIVDRLNGEINTGLGDPKIKARLADLGYAGVTGSPADYRRLIADEIDKWGKVIKVAGARPE